MPPRRLDWSIRAAQTWGLYVGLKHGYTNVADGRRQFTTYTANRSVNSGQYATVAQITETELTSLGSGRSTSRQCVTWTPAVCWASLISICTALELRHSAAEHQQQPIRNYQHSCALLTQKARCTENNSRHTVKPVLHREPQKTCHFILDHNSHVSWWIFTLPVPMETGMNTLHRSYKIYNFTP